jgi:cytochrome c-type biogenesis protein
MATSTLSLGLAVLGGLLTVFSPCVLPVLPIIVGRSLQSHRYGPLALVAGLVGSFALAGSLLGITASWFAHLAALLRRVAIASLLLIGLLTLFPQRRDSFGRLCHRLLRNLPIRYWLKAPRLKTPMRIGLAGEFWLGTQLGLLWTPCAGPVLGSILAIAAADHQVGNAFKLLLFFGIGAAWPMLMFAYGGQYFSHRLLRLRAHSAHMQRVGGALVVATAIAILLGWDVQLQLWLAPLFPALPL